MKFAVTVAMSFVLKCFCATPGAIARGVPGCSASAGKLMEEATVTCFIPANINHKKLNLVVYRDSLNSRGGELIVTDCGWEDGNWTCSNSTGYKSGSLTNESFTLRIPNFTQDHTGNYRCELNNQKNGHCTLEIHADSETLTQGTDTHESTTTFIQKAADPGTRAVKSVVPNIDNGITLIVTVAVCVCLVVMTAVITAGIVCCVKARRRQDQLRIRPDFAFANLNGALHELNISRDQARDIYEEIPDPPKAHRVSRVNSTSSSKSGVKLPPIPDMEQHEGTATLSPLKQAESCDFDGYLHPADICDQLP